MVTLLFEWCANIRFGILRLIGCVFISFVQVGSNDEGKKLGGRLVEEKVCSISAPCSTLLLSCLKPLQQQHPS